MNELKITLPEYPSSKQLTDEQIAKMAKIIDDRLVQARGYLGSMNKGASHWIAEELVKHYVPKDVIERLIKCLADNKEYDYESNSYKDRCETNVEHLETSDSSMFVIVETTGAWYVVYHKNTKVMYVVSKSRYNYGNFTLMVDENGKPLLWQRSS